MSKKAFKSSASSGRVVGFGGFGSTASQSSVLSYIQEPLDLTTISDARVVVIFKSLGKKDDTTKARALDDLQTAVDEANDLDDGILDCWIRLFPRLSIENDRRVRQLTHNVNGRICSKAGKRIAKHMPQIVGPWLAAQHDNDRAVSKAAQDSLKTVFVDVSKIAALRKVYYTAILEYCKNAITAETISSLSDARSVSKDDAENTYARVISSTLALLATMISQLESSIHYKHTDLYAEIITPKTLSFAEYADAGVRRSTHKLVRLLLGKLEAEIIIPQLEAISDVYVYKCLRSDQTGSSFEYLTTLIELTICQNTIWTTAYTGKKTPVSRLSHFVKQGAQGGPIEVWSRLGELLEPTVLPESVLRCSTLEIDDLLSAFRAGIWRKTERAQSVEAWRTYRRLIERLITMRGEELKPDLAEKHVLPVLEQYLHPTESSTEYTISSPKTALIAALLASIPGLQSRIEHALPGYTDKLIEAMKTSQPEQAKDYDKSQLAVTDLGERWALLQKEIRSMINLSLRYVFLKQDIRALSTALELCSARNGKAYGAAAIVDTILRECGTDLLERDEVRQLLMKFGTTQLPSLLFSPSSQHLTRCISVLRQEDGFADLLKVLVQAILTSDHDIQRKTEIIINTIPKDLPASIQEWLHQASDMQGFVSEVVRSQSTDDMNFIKLFISGILAPRTKLSCIKYLVQQLYQPDASLAALKRLDGLCKADKDALVAYDGDEVSANDHLIPNVLRLVEDQDAHVASLASEISVRLSIADDTVPLQSKLDIVRHTLGETGSTATSISVLIDMAKKSLGRNATVDDFLSCFPNTDAWLIDLGKHLTILPSSMSIISPFGGAINYVESKSDSGQLLYDAEGFSSILRSAIACIKLVASSGMVTQIASETSSSIRSLHQLVGLSFATVLAAEDKCSVSVVHKLWTQSATTEADFLSYATEVYDVISKFITSLTSEAYTALLEATATIEEDRSQSALSYYISYAKLRLTLMTESVSESKTLAWKEASTGLQQNTFATLAELIALASESSTHSSMLKITNELVASLTGLDFMSDTKTTQLHLIALNVILSNDDTILPRINKQRLVFLMKHMISALASTNDKIIGEETLKSLATLSPAIPDVYGEHWAEMLDVLKTTWSSISIGRQGTDYIPTLYHSLKLYAALKRLTTNEEPNEDLVDALTERQSDIATELMSLLKSTDNIAEASNQPLMTTNELLARQISSSGVGTKVDIVDLLPVLYTPSSSVQGAAFNILHEHIPKLQEQISLDAALDNKTARLPEELLSMLLEPPSVEVLDEVTFDRVIPPALQGYLYSWRLLFDYFNGSSYKVKTDYSEQLKDGTYLARLLDIVFDFLGHTRDKPADMSAYDVINYRSGYETDPEKDIQWLMSHLYYLALLNLPSLVKGYVRELRTRQTPAVIEEWTAKFISPSIINANLQNVADWSVKSVQEDPEYEKMTVKVGTRSKEVNVSYLVDEQTMAIKIILPDAYPLASAQVVGVSRVAVKEEKWQSWLRNCQGVITFSNGSITDGLAAWRRNVTGALKGQTECAICYSIISADKQLPTKRCPTCKNLFHSSCLFKWFKTSNASTCPLCRNPFNFN